jgi:hypothetical protein
VQAVEEPNSVGPAEGSYLVVGGKLTAGDLAAELGLRGPDVPDKITGWSHCTLNGQAAYDGYADVVARIDPGSRS